MITISDCPNSCGVKLLHGETSYKSVVNWMTDLAKKTYTKHGDATAEGRYNYTQFMYTHNPTKYQIGHDIKKYIEDNALGIVTVTPEGNNPVHRSSICLWIWTRDNEAFKKHSLELLNPTSKDKP